MRISIKKPLKKKKMLTGYGIGIGSRSGEAEA
jgi:hypothetical protein